MRKKIALYIIASFALIFQNLNSFAQNKEDKIRFAQEASNDGDYYSAAMYYEDLLTEDTTNIDFIFNAAESFRKYNEYDKSEKYYQIATKKDAALKYPESLFWLAMVQKNQGKYDDAAINFSEFYRLKSNDNSYFSNRAKDEMTNCIWAKKIKADSLDLIINHLDRTINSPYSEFAPRQLSDSILCFSSIQPNGDPTQSELLSPVYISRLYEAPMGLFGWEKPSKIQNEENPKIHLGNACYSSDYERMYFTRCVERNSSALDCEIYFSEKSAKGWSVPEKLDKQINRAGYTSTQPFICNWDKETDALFFVSNRPGGKGNLDIWCSKSKNNGKSFDEPVNLGEKINSVDNEITPFFDIKTKKLYYSSDGKQGIGGFDIFSSKSINEKWDSSENIGYPINTSYNDLYFTINQNDSDGYFVSNRPGIYYTKVSTCCYDIFSYEWLHTPKKAKKDTILIAKRDTVPTVEDKIKALLPLTLYFHNDEPNPNTTQIYTNKNYKQTLDAYVLLKDKYRKEYSRGLRNEEKTKAIADIDDFFTNYVESGFAKLNIFCELLAQELDSGRYVKIKVRGFCSPLASGEYNEYLAKRRINSMLNYLKSYNNGSMSKYIESDQPNGGRLIIIQEPLGEEKSSLGVSDNPQDQRNSVYSRSAAFERNIKILYYDSE
ncbi:MAG: hypothetical protein WCK02_14895 [Bacteroidota bacterium]